MSKQFISALNAALTRIHSFYSYRPFTHSSSRTVSKGAAPSGGGGLTRMYADDAPGVKMYDIAVLLVAAPYVLIHALSLLSTRLLHRLFVVVRVFSFYFPTCVDLLALSCCIVHSRCFHRANLATHSGPTTVLVMSLLFIGFVVFLHIWGKFRRL